MIRVTNDVSLRAAIQELNGKGGEIVLAPGEYGTFNGGSLRGVRGTPDNPLVFRSEERRKARFSQSPGGLNLLMLDCHHLVFDGLAFAAAPGAVWCIAAGWTNPYSYSAAPCTNIEFVDCLIDGTNCSQAVFTVNGSSRDWSMTYNEFVGGAAETIYLGGSPGYNDKGSGFLIAYNVIRGSARSRGVGGGEAIDVKPVVQKVTIVGNVIYDHVVSHSGVIVAAQNDIKGNLYPGGTLDVYIAENKIFNCKPSSAVSGGAQYYGASAINPCSEGTDVIRNIVWDCPGLPAINISGMTGNGGLTNESAVLISGNTTWNCQTSISYGGYGGTPTRVKAYDNKLHKPQSGAFPSGSQFDNNVGITSFTPPSTAAPVRPSAPPPPPPVEPPPPAPVPEVTRAEFDAALVRLARVERMMDRLADAVDGW